MKHQLEMRPVLPHSVFWEGIRSKETYVNISQIILKIVIVLAVMLLLLMIHVYLYILIIE